MSRTALLDGDLIAHRCAIALDDPIERVSEGLYRFDEEAAVTNAKAFVERILDETGCPKGTITFTASENYRKDVLPTYKGNRKIRKPILFKAVRNALIEYEPLDWFHIAGIEADDMMGILHTEDPDNTVICSADKDMLTIPGFHYNIFEPAFEGIVEVSEDEAERRFYCHVMSGDRTDGYPGAPGYGAVRANRALDPAAPLDHAKAWETVVEAFDGDEEEALINARCARILRAGEFNEMTMEPILWTPRSK